MNSDILSKISDSILRTGDQELARIISTAERKLKIPFFPKIMLVSNGYGRQDMMKCLVRRCGQMGILQEVFSENDHPFLVSFKFGAPDMTEQMDFFGEQECRKIELSVEWDFLKTANLVWLCGFTCGRIHTSSVEDADVIILATNATMALPQEEKNWIRDTVISSIDGQQTLVTLYGKDLVNTEEDYECLCRNVTAILNGMDKKIVFCDDLCSVFDGAARIVKSVVSEEQHKKMVIKSCLRSMEHRGAELLKISRVDLQQLKEAIDKIEHERKDIEMSGRLVIEGSVENMYADLKNQMISAADRYNEDAYSSIESRIQSTKNVEQDVNSIQPYLKAIWENFENEMKARLAAEQDKISGELEHQIELDCRNLVHMLELSEEYDFLQSLTIPGNWTGNRGETAEEDKKNLDKMLSKGMLIASIALAFVNPVWGVTAFVGTQVFQASRESSAEELRYQVLDELYGKCKSVKENVIDRIITVISEAQESSKHNISDVYTEMIDTLIDSILKLMEQIKNLQEQEKILHRIVQEEIPEVKEMI